MERLGKYKLLDGDLIREIGAAFLNNYSVIIASRTAGLKHEQYVCLFVCLLKHEQYCNKTNIHHNQYVLILIPDKAV